MSVSERYLIFSDNFVVNEPQNRCFRRWFYKGTIGVLKRLKKSPFILTQVKDRWRAKKSSKRR